MGYFESCSVSIYQYIESTLRKEKGPINTIISDEQINQMVVESDVDENKKKQLIELLKEYRTQLAPGFSDIHPAGSLFFIPHKIRLNHKNPIWTPQFRRAHKEEEGLNEEALRMFKQGVIERVLQVNIIHQLW